MSYSRLAKVGILAMGLGGVLSAPALAFDGGDAAKGEKVFKKCSSCHMVGEEAKNKVGPPLNNIFGNAAASVEDYKYGKSILAASEAGLVWSEEEVFEYLADPRKYLRAKLEDKKAKSKMSFKLKKEDDRKDVIAYLLTFSPDYGSDGEASESEESTEETTTN